MIGLSFLFAQIIVMAATQTVTSGALSQLHISATIPDRWQEQTGTKGTIVFADPKVPGDTLMFQTRDASNEPLPQAVDDAKRIIGVTGIVAPSIVAVTSSHRTVVTYMHLPQFGDPSASAMRTLQSICLM
jgi:hypothetical protein